jgi:hypothetical protein
MLRSLFLFFFIFLLIFDNLYASLNFELSRNGVDSNFSNNLFLGYSFESQADLQVYEQQGGSGLNWSIGYSFSDAFSVVSLIAGSPDFQIISKSHDINVSTDITNSFSVDVSGGLSDYNFSESRSLNFGASFFYQFSKVQIGFGLSSAEYFQIKNVFLPLINTDITDRLKFRQKRTLLYFDWQLSEELFLRLNTAQYSYEFPNAPNISSLDQMSNFITSGVGNILNQTGGSLANELTSQPAASINPSLFYSIYENWQFEFSLGLTRDQISPQATTTTMDLGLEYMRDTLNFGFLRLFANLEASRPNDIQPTYFSGTLGVGINL